MHGFRIEKKLGYGKKITLGLDNSNPGPGTY